MLHHARQASLPLLCLLALIACDDQVSYDPVDTAAGDSQAADDGQAGNDTPAPAADDGQAGNDTPAPAADDGQLGDDAPALAADDAVLVTVSPEEALAILEDPPEGLVVLDVRTAGEFERGHLEGAVQLDFYGDDFATQVDALDKEVPYLLYCQSGGRSGQTLTMMGELGFREVYEIDGGYGAWTAAGLPTVED